QHDFEHEFATNVRQSATSFDVLPVKPLAVTIQNAQDKQMGETFIEILKRTGADQVSACQKLQPIGVFEHAEEISDLDFGLDVNTERLGDRDMPGPPLRRYSPLIVRFKGRRLDLDLFSVAGPQERSDLLGQGIGRQLAGLKLFEWNRVERHPRIR